MKKQKNPFQKINLKLTMLILLAAVLAFAGSIVVGNNARAGRLKDLLLRAPLPAQTELLESGAVAGKLTGNGNGMQYRGAILVRSDLSGEELETHYRACFPERNVYVTSLSAPAGEHLLFPAAEGKPDRFQVMLFENVAAGTESSLWEALLNMDSRGH